MFEEVVLGFIFLFIFLVPYLEWTLSLICTHVLKPEGITNIKQ